jgi:hypothetical protein
VQADVVWIAYAELRGTHHGERGSYGARISANRWQ